MCVVGPQFGTWFMLTLLASRPLKCILDFWKICAPPSHLEFFEYGDMQTVLLRLMYIVCAAVCSAMYEA
jgi:hypothetical protein